MSLEQFYKRYKWTIYLAIILCWLVFIVFLGQPLREGKKGKKKKKGIAKIGADIKKRSKKIGKSIKKEADKTGVTKVATAAKCEADKVAIKGIDVAIEAVKKKYKMFFEFCFFPLDSRSDATGSCGVKEKKVLKKRKLKIREDNKKCFKKWFDKQKEKEEKKAEEAKNSYFT